MENLDHWVTEILADPVTKQPAKVKDFAIVDDHLDARVFLKNTPGYNEWDFGQAFYVQSRKLVHQSVTVEEYENWIAQSTPVYDNFPMSGRILDVGGADGLVRQHLSSDIEFISTDPWMRAISKQCDPTRASVYTCLQQPLNFIGATAEFQPFLSESFDWVHMRSMLDHVQLVDLALLEANRVLKSDGTLLVGLYVEGGKAGMISQYQKFKNYTKTCLEFFGIKKWKDYHLFHPTYKELQKVIEDAGFIFQDTFWQPGHNDQVCYISAVKE